MGAYNMGDIIILLLWTGWWLLRFFVVVCLLVMKRNTAGEISTPPPTHHRPLFCGHTHHANPQFVSFEQSPPPPQHHNMNVTRSGPKRADCLYVYINNHKSSRSSREKIQVASAILSSSVSRCSPVRAKVFLKYRISAFFNIYLS